MAGQLIQRGDNIWLVRVFLGRDGDGKRRYHNHTVHGNKKAAQAYLTTVLRERDLGSFVEPSRETVRQYLGRWLEAAAKPRLRERTYRSYEWLVTRHILPALGDKRLAGGL